MPRRKPPWLEALCEGEGSASLKARRCEGCREWVAAYTGGPVEERYDPGILDAKDLATAIILNRPFTRLAPHAGTTMYGLRDPCGARGIRPDGMYLAMHACRRTPISHRPYHPPKPPRHEPWDPGITLTDDDVRDFHRHWSTP